MDIALFHQLLSITLLCCFGVWSLSHVQLYCDLIDCGLPGSSVHGISRQGYWSGLPFPSPRDLSTQGSNLYCLHWQIDFFFFFFFTAEPPGKPWPCGMSWLFLFYRWGLNQSNSLSKVSTLEISKVEFGMHVPDPLGVLSTPSQWFIPSATLALEIQTREPLSHLHPWLPFLSKNPLKFGGVTKAKRSVFI